MIKVSLKPQYHMRNRTTMNKGIVMTSCHPYMVLFELGIFNISQPNATRKHLIRYLDGI